jgi:hypothetical protein
MSDLKAVELIEKKLAALHAQHETRPQGWVLTCVALNMEIRNIAKAMQEVIDDAQRAVDAKPDSQEMWQNMLRGRQHRQTLDQLVERYSKT